MIDTLWTVYDTTNSEIPDNCVHAVAIDKDGIIWVGTGDLYGNPGGLAAFNGTNWTVYDTSNSELPANYAYAIAVDKNNVKWISTFGYASCVYKDNRHKATPIVLRSVAHLNNLDAMLKPDACPSVNWLWRYLANTLMVWTRP